MLRPLLAFAAAALTSHVAHAASFPCAKAARPVEKLICGDPRLNSADESMGAMYRTALSKLPPASVGILRADQVQWLAWVLQVCAVPEQGDTQGRVRPTAATKIVTCMTPAYEKRTKELRQSVIERDGVRFLMRSQYLATLEVLEADAPTAYPRFGTLQVSWPVALASGPEWAAWNAAAEHAVYTQAIQGKTEDSHRGEPQWKPDLASGDDVDITMHLRGVEHGRATSAVTANYWRGAHPSESYVSLTWLLTESRPLAVSDVFAAGDVWRQVVGEACWRALVEGERRQHMYKELSGPGAERLQSVIGNVSNWTLEPDGLHISYPEYSIVPRNAQALMNDTVIPWTALQPVLAKGFIAP